MRRTPLLLALGLLAPACLDGLFGDDSGAAPPGGALGTACTRSADCRETLSCDARQQLCVFRGTTVAGGTCALTGECAAGLFCSPGGTCATSGDALEGGSCGDTASCRAGLVCVRNAGDLFGLCRAPRAPGSGDAGTPATGDAGTDGGLDLRTLAHDLGGACTDVLDCQAGLACDPSMHLCVAARSVAPALDGGAAGVWPGETCAPEETGATRAYFELPAADGSPPHDFFRLPFPNDVRRDATTGRLNLTGFPHPGTALLGFDLVDRYLRAAERSLDGFGTNGIVYFRFSNRIDFSTIRLGENVRLIDLTAGQPTSTLRFAANTAGNRYLCENPLMVDTGHGSPMEPGHTYAAFITAGVRDGFGHDVTPDADFPPMLAATAPTDASRARAWAAYAPLRTYLAAQHIDPTVVLVATVFTTQHPREIVSSLRDAVRAATAPAAAGFVRCDTGVRSPCDDGLTGADHVRGCLGAADAAFDELQGTIEIPTFQAGARPYREPGSGAIATDATGHPMTQGTERVCVTVTVPRGAAAPAGGWPVVLYAHGTGGTYRSVVSEGLASSLASVTDGANTARFTTLGFEGVMHGARRGAGVTTPPDQAFFNFANPEAARDNILQGAADVFAMVRALQTVTIPAAASGGADVRFDPRRIFFVGHSQGSTVGLPAAAYEPALAGMVFSGAGGDLRLSLTTKRHPIDIASLVPVVLQDPDARSAGHPVLNLLQAFFERSDAANFGHLVLAQRPTGVAARPVLQTYGLGDTYSTPPTMQVIAGTLGLPAAGAIPGGADAWPPGMGLAFPVSNNLSGVTAALLEADPAGAYDGHFVLFRDRPLHDRVMRFLASAAAGSAVIPP